MRPVPLATDASSVRGAWRVNAQKELSLIFTREADGTRNLWQATATEEGEWPQKPLTHLTAPLWADEAQVSRDGDTIVCVTNAVGDNQMPQIARLDIKTGRFEAITRDSVMLSSPALSPDGKSLAFVRETGNTSTIFLLSLTDKIAPSIPRRVIEGRRPAWLDNGTLLFSDVRKNGLYRLDIPADWPPLLPLKSKPRGLAFRGGEVTVVPDASQLCIALDDDRNGNPGHLFFMASNGSGERALRNTDGAHAPRFAPDGTALLFDAPLSPNGPRTLWVMNLAPVVPTVEIARVAADKAGLYIIGTVFCEDSPEVDVKLEVGQGDAPQQWQTIATPKAPLQKEALTRWQPPEGAGGDWTLRLTATSPDGDSAQTIMTLALPLAIGRAVTNTSPDVSIFVAPVTGAAGLIGTHGIDSEVIPGEWVKGVFIPRGPKTFPEKNRNTVPNPGLSNPEIVKVTPSNQSVSKVPPIAPPVALSVPPKEIKNDAFVLALPSLPLPALPPPPPHKGALPDDSGAPYVTPLPALPPLPTSKANPLNLANLPVRQNDSRGKSPKTFRWPKREITRSKDRIETDCKSRAKTNRKSARANNTHKWDKPNQHGSAG